MPKHLYVKRILCFSDFEGKENEKGREEKNGLRSGEGTSSPNYSQIPFEFRKRFFTFQDSCTKVVVFLLHDVGRLLLYKLLSHKQF